MKKKRRKNKAKIPVVINEFKEGTLHSSSGELVTDKDQAMAIAMSEAGMSKKSRHGSGEFTDEDIMCGYRRV